MDSAPTTPARAPIAPGAPLIGLAARMRARPLETMEQAFLDTGDGEAIFLKLGPYKATLVRHPELIKRIFVDNAANYTKRTRGYLKARLVLGDLRPNQVIFGGHDPAHRNRRRRRRRCAGAVCRSLLTFKVRPGLRML